MNSEQSSDGMSAACRDCGKGLAAGYLCDECDRVELSWESGQ